MDDERAVLYIRQLPGGGYVSIEGSGGGTTPYWGGLCVERRSIAGRRDGHPPPVVMETTGPSQQAVFDRLLSVANSNVAVATALLRWQAREQRMA